jgi:hypothetical protein
MIIYAVKEKMYGHEWLSTAGTYTVTNEALGNRIQRLLEEDGCQVKKEDTAKDESNT